MVNLTAGGIKSHVIAGKDTVVTPATFPVLEASVKLGTGTFLAHHDERLPPPAAGGDVGVKTHPGLVTHRVPSLPQFFQ
jgi:hypothetical protein